MAVAGSITVAASKVGPLTRYEIDWLSSAGGEVTENTFSAKSGELVEVRFVPDGGGTQPTDAYDLTITDADGTDILAGTGANLSNATATAVVPVISTYFRRHLTAGLLTPTIANAGNAKGGTIVLLVR